MRWAVSRVHNPVTMKPRQQVEVLCRRRCVGSWTDDLENAVRCDEVVNAVVVFNLTSK